MALTPTDRAAELGTKPVATLLWKNCLQTTAAVGIYGVYALTNAWFVARGVNEVALAGVNLVAPLLLVLGAVSTTVGTGGAALVSLALGRRDSRRAGRAAGNAFVLYWLTALLITVLGLVFMDQLMDLLGAVGEVRVYAREYATVLLIGALTATGFSAIVRAEGRVGFSTLMWTSAVLIQIACDPLFIFVLDMGVAGAGWGTVAGQTVSACLAYWFFFGNSRRPYIIGMQGLRFDPHMCAKIATIGTPSFLTGAGATLLTVLINKQLGTNGLVAAATALAAYAVCSRMQTFVTMPLTGIAQALAPLVGYNVGAHSFARVRSARSLALKWSVLYAVGTAVVLAVSAPWLVTLFVQDSETVAVANSALRIVSVAVACAGFAPIVSTYFQSCGKPRPSYFISIGTLLGIKVPLVLFVGSLSLTWLWWSIALGELSAALVALLVLRGFDLLRSTR